MPVVHRLRGLMAKVEDLRQYNLEALHSAVSAGEPLNREVIETFQKHFHITVRDGYGQNGKYIACWCNERDGY